MHDRRPGHGQGRASRSTCRGRATSQEIRFDPTRSSGSTSEIWEALRAEVDEAYARTTRRRWRRASTPGGHAAAGGPTPWPARYRRRGLAVRRRSPQASRGPATLASAASGSASWSSCSAAGSSASTPSSSTRSSGASRPASGPTLHDLGHRRHPPGLARPSRSSSPSRRPCSASSSASVLGVVCGDRARPRSRLPRRAASRPFIKVAELDPAHRARARSSSSPSASASSRRSILAVVLVFFGVFFNAFQGAREVDRNLIANARILGASRWQVTRHVVLPVGVHLDPRQPAHQLRLRPHRRRSSARSSAPTRAWAC